MTHIESVLNGLTELSGDRTGELGESINTGMACVGACKLVLLAGGEKYQSHSPGGWRRASRIVGLARQLRKPLLLWNLSLHSRLEQTRNLGTEQSAREGRQDIIRFPFAIVSVIEGAQNNAFSAVELAVPDGIVFVDGAESLWGHLTISPRTIVASSAEEIATGISELLTEIISVPANELVSRRGTRLASIALS